MQVALEKLQFLENDMILLQRNNKFIDYAIMYVTGVTDNDFRLHMKNDGIIIMIVEPSIRKYLIIRTIKMSTLLPFESRGVCRR